MASSRPLDKALSGLPGLESGTNRMRDSHEAQNNEWTKNHF